jgi:MarR family transcriptional regulator, transcriptional regulator for hemolysin
MAELAPQAVDLSFLLNQASYAFGAHLGGALAGVGLSVRDYCVLLKAAPGDLTQNEVAERAALDKTTMVATLDRLERDGLAERQISSADRRARVVAVTPKGRKLLARAVAIVEREVEEALAPLGVRQRAAFLDSLQLLTAGRWAAPSHTAPKRRKAPRAQKVSTG